MRRCASESARPHMLLHSVTNRGIELPSSAVAVIHPFSLLESLRLARLAAVSPSSRLLLVLLHARPQYYVYSRWRGEAE